MRNRIIINRIIAALLVSTLISINGNASTSPGESVVRIKTKGAHGSGVGSGFVWLDPLYVVTALHVVAGAEKISVYSEGKKKTSAASIHTALLEPDLALLKLDRDIGLSPLQIDKADPNSTEKHFIWGYPHDVSEMTRHQVEMVGGLNKSPSLASIFKNKKQLESTIGIQGYPSLDARILRITKIQPGHSGAPILDSSGKVVGIGDGGLRDGLGGLNWAIPASIYLPDLVNSRDPIPGQSSVQSSLFNVAIDEKPVKFEETDDHVLRRVWQATLAEILEVLEEDRLVDTYRDLDASAREDAGRSLSEAIIDVYEDEETGATFAVPQNYAFEYDVTNKLLIAGAQTGPQMLIQAKANDSWDQGVDSIEKFTAILNDMGIDWQKDPEWRDIREVDRNEQYAYYNIYRWVPDDIDEDAPPLAELDAVLLIDNNDFLGTAVVARDEDTFTSDDWYNHYLLMMCVKFADFVSY